MLISSPIIIPDQCQHYLGSVNISISGGLAPYIYIWSNSQTTQDINNLSEGNYSVTISDVNGCTASGTYHVPDNNNGLIFSNVNVYNDYCTNNQGYISISITGRYFSIYLFVE